MYCRLKRAISYFFSFFKKQFCRKRFVSAVYPITTLKVFAMDPKWISPLFCDAFCSSPSSAINPFSPVQLLYSCFPFVQGFPPRCSFFFFFVDSRSASGGPSVALSALGYTATQTTFSNNAVIDISASYNDVGIFFKRLPFWTFLGPHGYCTHKATPISLSTPLSLAQQHDRVREVQLCFGRKCSSWRAFCFLCW